MTQIARYNLNNPPKHQDSNCELWSVNYEAGSDQKSRSGLLLLVDQAPSEDIIKIWKSLPKDQLAPYASHAPINGSQYSPGWYYIQIEADWKDGELDPLLCVQNTLQSISTLQNAGLGLSCEKLEDWMFVPTPSGNKIGCRLIPTHLLPKTTDKHDLSRKAGQYLLGRFPNLPHHCRALLERLMNDNNPLDIALLLNESNKGIWQENALNYSITESFVRHKKEKTTDNQTEYELTWEQPPAGTTVRLLRLKNTRVSKFHENFRNNGVYFQNEILPSSHPYGEVITSGECPPVPVQVSEHENDGITIVPFLVSEPLYRCLRPIRLGGPEDIAIRNINFDDNKLHVDIQWSHGIANIHVIIRDNCHAKSVLDVDKALFFDTLHFYKKMAPQVICKLEKGISDQLFVSIFAFRSGSNTPINLVGTQGYFKLFDITLCPNKTSSPPIAIFTANCNVKFPDLVVKDSRTQTIIGNITAGHCSRGHEIRVSVPAGTTASSIRMFPQSYSN